MNAQVQKAMTTVPSFSRPTLAGIEHILVALRISSDKALVHFSEKAFAHAHTPSSARQSGAVLWQRRDHRHGAGRGEC
jgi:hypothetical protein